MLPLPPELRWIADGLAVALLAGLALALVVSLLLVLRPALALALNARLSRWVDTRPGFEALEAPRRWERFYYRHHRILGAAISAGALYVLLRWATAYDRAAALRLLAGGPLRPELDWLPPAIESVVLVLHALALAVGLVVLARPSLLKSIEQAANRWYAPARATALDRAYGPLDRGVAVYPRLWGFVLLLGSVWALLVLAPRFAPLLGG